MDGVGFLYWFPSLHGHYSLPKYLHIMFTNIYLGPHIMEIKILPHEPLLPFRIHLF